VKVLDLQCAAGHAFEGWFGSEEDFLGQQARALVQCPMCGSAEVLKKLSAPRLNLHSPRGESTPNEPSTGALAMAKPQAAAHLAAWLDLSRRLVENTTDVGDRFAEEARKIHYGEVPEHAIRGKTTPKEARDLIDEGIAVMPLLLPESAKGNLQ